MSPLIKEASVQAVLAAADIVDVVSGYTNLRKRGATFTGLCPFHQEKTPSFSVSADKGLYYCFGCGEGGSVFTFLQRVENLDFTEAVERLAQRYGVLLEYEEGKGPDAAAKAKEQRLLALLDKAASFYSRYLWDSPEGERARAYLTARGLQRPICEEYRVGYAPSEWRGLARRALSQGFNERELDAAGLTVNRPGKYYDRFRGRLMFPLVDHRGNVVGFGGRTLGDDTPKYLNSPEGPLYVKGRLLYGLHEARRAIVDADEAIIVEGYTDVIALAQAGVRNVVASMGTALTEKQIELLTRLTPNLTFMFDADRAGVDAVLRSGELSRGKSLRPMVVLLPNGKDPADAATSQRPEALRALLDGKVSFLRFEVMRLLESGDTASPEGRVRAFEAVKPVLARCSSAKELEEEVRAIAAELRLSTENVQVLLSASGNGAESRLAKASRSDPPGKGRPGRSAVLTRILTGEASLEREFLVAVVCQPQAALPLLETLTLDHFVDPVCRGVFNGVVDAVRSESLPETLAALATGDSEEGRFFVRLALEAEGDRYSEVVLRELHLRLQEQRIKRSVADLERRLEQGTLDPREEGRLVELERLQHQIRTALATMEE